MSYWKKEGFLVNIPEERQDEADRLLSFTYFLMAQKPFGKLTTLVPPIIIRILKVMSLSDEQVRGICHHCFVSFDLDFQTIENEGVLDPELEYCKRYAENYIKTHVTEKNEKR